MTHEWYWLEFMTVGCHSSTQWSWTTGCLFAFRQLSAPSSCLHLNRNSKHYQWYYCNTTPPCMWFPNVSNVFGFCFCWMPCHFLAWKNDETRVAGLRLEGTWATWIARKLLQKELLIVTGQKERQGGVNSKVLDRDCQGRQIRQLDNAETGREVEMGGGFNP